MLRSVAGLARCKCVLMHSIIDRRFLNKHIISARCSSNSSSGGNSSSSNSNSSDSNTIATSTAAASSPAVAAAVAKPAQWQPPQQQQFSTALGFTEAPCAFSPQSARVQSCNVKPEALGRHSSPQTYVSKCHYDNLPIVSPTSIRLGPTGTGVTEHARASCTSNVLTKNSQTKKLEMKISNSLC